MLKLDSAPRAETQSISPKLERLGRSFFPRRLLIGLFAVVPAAFIVQPGNYFGEYQAVGIATSLLLVIGGLGLRAWAASRAGDHTRTIHIEAPALVTGGPYSMVRNPIYLGTIILGLGMVGLIGDPRMLFLCAITFAALYFGIIPAEEQFLRQKFGAEYIRYCFAVPRLLPRLQPWSEARVGRVNWEPARGELYLALLLVAIYGFLRLAAWLRGF
ncbi:MAG: hypothetical protein JWL59_2416 [Chthoniobacteraceae bacterium]|nr:hypothetical protein [Chthoniobacteraceae bacterium]